jgi:hypothetical protein
MNEAKRETEQEREGLETARCPTGVGSNPTPRTKFAQNSAVWSYACNGSKE